VTCCQASSIFTSERPIRAVAKREKPMTSQLSIRNVPDKPATAFIVLHKPKEAARILRVSVSWLAKARMRGDGPAYIKVGRSIRYTEAALTQWMKSRQRLSTSEQ
jgi:helix-turn-helix protein